MSIQVSAETKTDASGLLNAVAERLVPLFLGLHPDRQAARAAAIDAIQVYSPTCAAEYVTIGRILALSFAAMAAADRSTDPDLTSALQLRYLDKAATVSRSVGQSERAILQRDKAAPIQPVAQPPAQASPQTKSAQPRRIELPPAPPPELLDINYADMQAAVAAAMAEYRAVAVKPGPTPQIGPSLKASLLQHAAMPPYSPPAQPHQAA